MTLTEARDLMRSMVPEDWAVVARAELFSFTADREKVEFTVHLIAPSSAKGNPSIYVSSPSLSVAMDCLRVKLAARNAEEACRVAEPESVDAAAAPVGEVAGG